jgi:hypothetical protein
MERAGYPRNPLGDRIGERFLPPHDARHRLDRIYLSEMVEAEVPPGPTCFRPRIMKEEHWFATSSCPRIQEHMMAAPSRKIDSPIKPQRYMWLEETAVGR